MAHDGTTGYGKRRCERALFFTRGDAPSARGAQSRPRRPRRRFVVATARPPSKTTLDRGASQTQPAGRCVVARVASSPRDRRGPGLTSLRCCARRCLNCARTRAPSVAELFVAPKQVSRARGVPSGHDRRVRLLLLAHDLALEAHVSQGAQGAASAGAAVSRIAGRTTTRDAPPAGRIYAQTWPRGGFFGFGFVSIRRTNAERDFFVFMSRG